MTSFEEVLARIRLLEGKTKPSSPQKKQELEAIRTLAAIHRLQMNLTLLQDLSDTSTRDASGLIPLNWVGSAWWLHLVELIKPLEEASASMSPEDTASVKGETSLTESQASVLKLSGQDFDALIEQAARRNDLDSNLVRAVIKAESDFNPMTESKKGARGLMQLMPGTARELGVMDTFDPVQNIEGGCRYLRQMLDRYSGDLSQALAAYNWGPGNLDRSQGSLPEETRTYLKRVQRFFRQFTAVAKA
ncbi:MAG: lytic transglycosylase domain-containing protein [Deltaproteobacteria bacterium]|nr:lytic transglycosylase domain-containing protein [Deltaproteobacteria bacterium]MBW2086516.1 lytic transglycosylase domain-containing protein [Deltaproteobacteria bacterium]